MNASLRERTARSEDEWFRTYWKDTDVSESVVRFVYRQIGLLFGLDASRVHPGDDLLGDLRIDKVAWKTWDVELVTVIHAEFGITPQAGEMRDWDRMQSVADLVTLIDRAVKR